jgi:hypothetical protein
LDPATLAAHRAEAEVELVARVLAFPRIGATVAAEAGIVPGHFDQDDALLLYCACVVALEAGLSKLDTLRLARRALQAAHLWDPTQIADHALTAMRHSDETLARLATCRLCCPLSVRRAAAKLLRIIARQIAAADLEAA